ncbi:MAG TPA: BTAD domain-containing putative transcriptional regulator [Thermomicrobiales bacterium]|nr:BTAD domain-containing putative transcriptional regulator [Thermomicrobiales bacterium]
MSTQLAERPSPRPMLPLQSDYVLVCLLGGFRLLRHGQPLDALVAGKAMTLLSTLALHVETGVPREALLDLLWPERDDDQAAASLHSLIYGLHRRLHVGARGASTVVYTNGSYALNRAAGVSTDIVRFDALIAEGNRLAAAKCDVEAASHYEHALALYRGDLSVGTDIYTVIERERLRANFLTALAWLADQSYRAGEFGAALTHASRLLAYDPCREDAHRVVMRTHVRRGERAQALRQYRLCEVVLRREFDAPPEAATTALFDRIRSDPATL